MSHSIRMRWAWLAAAGLLLLMPAAGCGFSGGDGDHAGAPAGPVRHVILFIGDGMQLESAIAASRYLYGVDRGLVWDSFPYQAYAATWDVNTYNAYAGWLVRPAYDEAAFDPLVGYDPAWGGAAPYPVDLTGQMPYLLGAATDSAAAATALATGVKTDSGNLAWLRNDPPGGALETIAEAMRAHRGAAIGVVTTVPFNHATPAAFVSHNVDRNNYAAIADEIITGTAPEVVIGGGHPNWSGGFVTAAQLDAWRLLPDYRLVERVPGLDGGASLLYAASALPAGRKLFGLFGGAGGDFAVPIPLDNPGFPGFLVGSEDPLLADATEAALTVLSRDPDGFFLMVEEGDIDHSNHANNFASMIGGVWELEEAVAAAVAYVDRPGDDLDWDNTLLIVTADHATGGLRLDPVQPLGRGVLPSGGEYTYHTGGHTNELVTVSARGARLDLLRSAEKIWYPGVRILDNTQLYRVMAAAAGLP